MAQQIVPVLPLDSEPDFNQVGIANIFKASFSRHQKNKFLLPGFFISPHKRKCMKQLSSIYSAVGCSVCSALLACLISAPVFAADETVVKIGHAGATSGTIAHLGKDTENGARMAIEELNAKGTMINGKKVKFVLVPEDDGADPKQGATVAQKLVDAKVNAVVGHLTSGASIPAAKIYNMAGIPEIAPSVTSINYTSMGYKTAFRVVASDAFIGTTLGTYAIKNLNAKTIAVIDDRSSYGQGLADQFIKGVKAANPGVKMAQRQFTNDKATDFNAILTAIKASKPDVIFYGGYDAVAGPMLRQMKALGINAKLMGGDGICSEQIIKLAGTALNNGQVYCAVAGGLQESEKHAMDQFKQSFKKRFGADVQLYAPNAYDAVMTFADAMQQAKSSDPEVYLPYLRNINHKGVTGDIAFDGKGDLKNGALTLHSYKNGKRTTVSVIK